MPRRRSALVLALLLSLLVAACGGGGGDDTDVATPTSEDRTTTSRGSTTSSSDEPSTTASSTTPAPPPPTYVLTGLPADDPARMARPILGIKIDNHPNSRPHVGLNQADVVFEELVEGSSRYLAVFQSHDSDPVGPVRSARESDIDIMANLGTMPLFANSGGNANVMAAVRRAPLVEVGHGSAAGGLFYRQSGRGGAPHNLFVKTSDLFARAIPESAPPATYFRFAASDAGPPATGEPVESVTVRFESTRATYRWSPVTKGWDRELNGTLHVDDEGILISPKNVVIMFVNYRRGITAGSEVAQTVGSGEVWVLTRNALVPGTWSRPSAQDPYTFTDATGAPILLTPGQTWIELPEPGEASVQAPGGG